MPERLVFDANSPPQHQAEQHHRHRPGDPGAHEQRHAHQLADDSDVIGMAHDRIRTMHDEGRPWNDQHDQKSDRRDDAG